MPQDLRTLQIKKNERLIEDGAQCSSTVAQSLVDTLLQHFADVTAANRSNTWC